MEVKLSKLKEILEKIISSKYYSKEQANKIIEVLIYAEIIGKNTQGILKLLGSEPIHEIKPNYSPKLIKETSNSALIDGGASAGPLAVQTGCDIAIQKAKESGVAIIGVNNTFSSSGAIGFYARKIANEGLIGIVSSGSERAMNHYKGIDPIYGTNPIAFGFPTLTSPIVFDMASAAITYYGLIRASILGEEIPKNVAIDKNGNLTTNPNDAQEGAILSFDNSYKGSGLAMMIELLTGPLTGADYCHEEGQWGTSIIIFSPNLLVGEYEFKKHASKLVEKVKGCRTKNSDKIHIPGFDSESKLSYSEKDDVINIDDEIYQKLQDLLENISK
jgi:LDH2 family malate/lactate/ureidoglycolate dehydrogenase